MVSSEPGSGEDRVDGTVALGRTLRLARERRNRSTAELARRMRLETRVIERLENEHFDQLPGPAFVRGYIRAIAKELGIDSAPLLAAFDEKYHDDGPALSDFKSRAPTQITSDSNLIKYTTVVVCATIAILAASWWRAQDAELSATSTGAEMALARARAPTTAVPLSYSFDIVVHPETPYYRAPADPGMPDADSGADAALPPTRSSVVIRTSEEAWLEVTDRDAHKLYYNLARPGQEIVIDGDQPYQLTIGNATAVTVQFDGEIIDTSSYMVNGVARFSLGTSE